MEKGPSRNNDVEDCILIETELRYDLQHYLDDFWEKKMSKHLDILAFPLASILTHHLQIAHLQMKSMGQADEFYDPNSFYRSAIEPHEQDNIRHALDILINASRDVLSWLIKNNYDYAHDLIQNWFDSKVPLLKRLAIHGIRESYNLTADEKIEWIINRDLLWAINEMHEIFQLLKDTYQFASENIRLNLLKKIESGYQVKEGENIDEKIRINAVIKALDWLHRADPSCPLVAERFKKMKSKNPEYKEPEYLDLHHWIGSVYGPISPVSVEELLKKDPEQEIDWLLSFKGDDFDGSDRDGLLNVINQAVVQNFDWGMKLLYGLRKKEACSSDVWNRALFGLRDIPMDEGKWGRVLDFLLTSPIKDKACTAITNLLLQHIRKGEGEITSSLLPKAEQLADSVWMTLDLQEETENYTTDDWMSIAINRPGGNLAEFYILRLLQNSFNFTENY
jgi:hypothetical protein